MSNQSLQFGGIREGKRPTSLSELLKVSAQVRVATSDLLRAVGEIVSLSGRGFDRLILRTRAQQLILRTPVEAVRGREAFRFVLPCSGQFNRRFAVPLAEFSSLYGAAFYESETGLTLCADDGSFYVGKYWLPAFLEAPRSPNFTVQDRELHDRIAILDAQNLISPPAGLEALARRYERDETLSNLLKRARGHACQICGSNFITMAGDFYTECHHLEHLANGGLDVSRNMIVLCANHHRQFHFGRVNVVEHSMDILAVKIGEVYRCRVGPES